ncbi:hypothetical protein NECID01_1663 [Nematocida sp. AWRm77]|nr:hypothetical protein NECID01_1663 [Nematocida sp. AWRm77]
MKYKKDRRKFKPCNEVIKEISFNPSAREEYLNAQKKRRVNARRERIQQEKEEKKEVHREKRRTRKRKQQETADLAQRVLEVSKRSHEEEKVIGDSIVTIREL